MALILAVVTTHSTANDCDVVRQAAEQGRVSATVPLNNIEEKTAERINTAATCVETFNQVAQKITMMTGGFDLGPAKQRLRSTACSVANRAISQVGNEVKRKVSDEVGVDIDRARRTAESAGMDKRITRPGEQASGSVWGRVSCALGGC
jgi:hypothetical protein